MAVNVNKLIEEVLKGGDNYVEGDSKDGVEDTSKGDWDCKLCNEWENDEV